MKLIFVTLLIGTTTAHANPTPQTNHISYLCPADKAGLLGDCIREGQNSLLAAGCKTRSVGIAALPSLMFGSRFSSYTLRSQNCANVIEDGETLNCPAGFSIIGLKTEPQTLAYFQWHGSSLERSTPNRICIRTNAVVF